ncbi:DUF5666 domain-containing protein [Wenzhouxiangella limi]|uniref:DUF5666 domain-containing protein n=1 Tax=Wenzhouxiangella limi TaxID=2707351 RepID=A0A845UUA6_9GAMM|nr:DUF5666 domain-containing protein [Wenzhouxiangella limi]NDY95087.1 hypothetical protein [Wenzhouxiangella limi]
MKYPNNPNTTKVFTKKALAVALMAGGLAFSVQAQDPREQPDESWISLAGTVTSTTPDSFRLDYGDGMITVEMDDWDTFGDAWPLMDGDRVTVYGKVDQNLFANTTIEAGSVYVEDLNTFFYASPADEEEYGAWVVTTDVVPGDLTYIGTVESASPMTNTFTIDTGATELSVDTTALPYDPLDDEGFQQIDVGDRVSVDAVIDADFIGDQDLLAESVVTLSG